MNDELKTLTLEDLKTPQVFEDKVIGAYRYVVVIGTGNDWAVYCAKAEARQHEIVNWGDKICSWSTISSLINADTKVRARYRL